MNRLLPAQSRQASLRRVSLALALLGCRRSITAATASPAGRKGGEQCRHENRNTAFVRNRHMNFLKLY
ncbi:MAG: hypothetical protein IPH54_12720 [Rhodoferax sp.]|nr:hypothetical protein [Rhodoferax sp.]